MVDQLGLKLYPTLCQAPEMRISGDLSNTDNVMNNTFWIGVQPALTKEMLEFVVQKIETYLGLNF